MDNVIENLIEELKDEELATCMGGCINVNPAGKGIPYIVGPNGQLQGTSRAPGQLNNSGNGLTYVGDPNSSVRYVSDRAVKGAFAAVDVQQVLAKVATLPITTWKYTEEADSVRHMGPMSQDFAATFRLGDSDRSIQVVDVNGVTLAAIQGLYQMLVEKNTELDALRAEIQALKQLMQAAV